MVHNPPLTSTVYHLIDPRDNMPFYVGSTVTKLKHRLCSHIGAAKKPRWPVNYRIKEIVDAGFVPVIEAIDEGEYLTGYPSREEEYWIRQYRFMGFILCNVVIPDVPSYAAYRSYDYNSIPVVKILPEKLPEPTLPMPDISDRFAMLRWHQERRALKLAR